MGDRLRVTVEGPEPLVLDLPAAWPETDRRDGPRAGPAVVALPISAADRTEGRRRFEVVVDSWRFEVLVESAARAELRERGGRAGAGQAAHVRSAIRAQIPGRVLAVHVAAGEAVEAGQRLLSIEAMKMENEVRAARAGTIERVAVAAGARVELGDELVVIG